MGTNSAGTGGAPWTRRQFIAAAALGGAVRAQSLTDGYIDAHAHVWSADTERWPRRPQTTGPADFPPETLLEYGRASGVTRVVLIQLGAYGNDNAYMLQALRLHPGRFSAVARMDDAAPAAREVMAKLAGQGVRGFRISLGGEPGAWLDAPGMARLWEFAAERNLAICPLIDPSALPSIDRMCARHPETTVVIDHFARIGGRGTFPESDVAGLCALARHKRVHVKISAFHALGKKTPPYLDMVPLIRRVVDAFGADRLMWGTDSPFQVTGGHTYAASIELIRDRLDFLSRADREALLRGTAARVFFG